MSLKTFFQPNYLSLNCVPISSLSLLHFNAKPQVTKMRRKQCFFTTRMRAITRRYWLARTAIRHLTKFAYLSGHRKASW